MVVAVVALAATAGATNHFIISKSAQVKNGALQAKDLSKKARATLRGNRGPRGRRGRTGATGPVGPPGTNGTNGTNGADGATGQTGAAGATGPRGPSDAFTVHRTSINQNVCNPAPCPAGTSPVLASLSLPAGSFVVNSSVTLDPNADAANLDSAVECHLNYGSTFERTIENYEDPGAGITSDQTVHVNTAFTQATAGAVTITCTFGNVAYNASSPRITAIQVGSLADTVL